MLNTINQKMQTKSQKDHFKEKLRPYHYIPTKMIKTKKIATISNAGEDMEETESLNLMLIGT